MSDQKERNYYEMAQQVIDTMKATKVLGASVELTLAAERNTVSFLAGVLEGFELTTNAALQSENEARGQLQWRDPEDPPEKNGYYIAWWEMKDGKRMSGELFFRKHGDDTFWDDEDADGYPIPRAIGGWMPLPAPPEADDE